MDDKMPDLIGTWNVQAPLVYFGMTGLFSLIIRAFSSLLKALEKKKEASYWRTVFENFSGFPSDETMRDYWFPFLLGWIELLCFPILIRVGAWVAIGAWLAFKTLSQWKRWEDHRPAFNRFLIGNALVLISSFYLARYFIFKQ